MTYRNQRRWTLLLLFLTTLCLPFPSQAAGTGDIPRLATELATPGALRVDNQYVLWSEQVQPSRFQRIANLYYASLADRQPHQLAADLPFADYFGPLTPGFDLDNNIAVWVDEQLPDQTAYGLLAQNLRTGQRWTVTTARAAYPLIEDTQVVWWENLGWGGSTPNQQAQLKIRDLNTMDPPRDLAVIPAPRDYLIRSVQINASWVIWMQGSYDHGESNPACWRLYGVQTAIEAPIRQIADLGCDANAQQSTADLTDDLGNSPVAYTASNGMLVVDDLAAGTQAISGPHHNLNQTWAGRYLFWNSLTDSQLWGYDPRSDSAFPLASSRLEWPIAGSQTMLAWVVPSETGIFSIHAQRVAQLLPNAARAADDPAVVGRMFFTETGHTLGGAFREFWRTNGGLPVFGYSLTEEFTQRMPGTAAGSTVQYLERQRFELHPEHAGTPYLVLLGRLGAEALAARGQDWQQFPKADPATAHYFPATGQAIAPEFWDYWRTHGLELGDAGVSEREALALWGYPISPLQQETMEDGVVRRVQWFERARFELHPENPPPYQVLLGRLAATQVDSFGWQQP